MEATSVFLRHVDYIFDKLNVSNPKGKRMKAPFTMENIDYVTHTLDDALDYLMELKMGNGVLVRKSRRKTGLVGFKCAVHEVMKMARDLLTRDK